jgi:O-antigen ligase
MPTAVEQRVRSDRRRLPRISWRRTPWVVVAVAAITFLLALDDGAYSLSSRTSLTIAVWWIVGLAWLSGGWPSIRPAKALAATVALLGALALWTAASVSWAHDDAAAYDEVVRVLLYLGVVMLVATLVERSELRQWADGFAVGILLVALLALASRFFPDVIDVDARYRFLSGAVARLSYPIGYWNGLAILVALAVPLLLRLATAATHPFVRVGSAAAFVPVSAILYLTSSRGGVLVALVGALSFFAFAPSRWPVAAGILAAAAGAAVTVAILRRSPELVNHPLSEKAVGQGHSTAALLCVAAAATAIVFLAATTVARWVERRVPERFLVVGVAATILVLVIASSPIERVREFKKLPQSSVVADGDYVQEHLLSGSGNGRWQYWEVAGEQFRSSPLHGDGAGSFHEAWEQNRPIGSYVLDAHSLYLEVLGELGVVGFALILGLVIVAGVVIVQSLRRATQAQRPTVAALSAALVAFGIALGVDWMWELTVVAVVGIAILTLLATARPASRSSWRPPVQWRAAVVATALVAAVVSAIPLLASERIEASQAAVRGGEVDDALSAARAARDLEPWAAAPYLQLALVEEEAGRLRAARAWLAEAQERDPRNAGLWLVAARLDTKSGRIDAARMDLRRARKLNPLLRLPT